MCLAGIRVFQIRLVSATGPFLANRVSEADNAPADKDAHEIFAPEHVAGSIASSIRLSGTQGGVS
jgi:hypothetical protein